MSFRAADIMLPCAYDLYCLDWLIAVIENTEKIKLTKISNRSLLFLSSSEMTWPAENLTLDFF